MTFNARYIANIIQFAAQQGADKKQLLSITGKSMTELEAPELSFEADVYNQIIKRALELTGDDYLGLHLGDHLSLSAAGLIVQIVQSSETVLQALQYMVEFANLGCQALPFQLREREDDWELSMLPNPMWEEQAPWSVRHTMDGVMAFTLREYHTLTRHQYYPERVHFAYARPARFMEYEKLFRCPVHFNQAYTSFFLDKKQVSEKIVTRDYHLLQVLVKYAEEKLMFLQKQKGFSAVVRQTVLHLVKPQFPSIEQVAVNLNLSVRTLQRRLKEENLTYKMLLDELRRQFALDYLGKEQLSVKKIAYLLNYSDASSFVRSFRRWTGKSPAEYRRQAS